MGKAGRYGGGIRTVEDLRQRCFVDPDTGCWLWRMALHDGVPKVHLLRDGESTWMRGRRAALFLSLGRDLAKGQQAFAKLTCQSEVCVNPDCARSGSRMQHGEWLRKTGKGKTPAKKAAAQVTAKARRKLTAEQVMEIRRSGMSSYAAAAKFGVSQYAAWSAKSGKSWKQVRTTSVFDWSGQAAG